MLKLYIYGYLNRVRSSRRLEAECHRNVEVIWLLRTLKPDFKTIADFRADNCKAFRAVFRQFVLLCRKLDLFGRELLAVDGTFSCPLRSLGMSRRVVNWPGHFLHTTLISTPLVDIRIHRFMVLGHVGEH